MRLSQKETWKRGNRQQNFIKLQSIQFRKLQPNFIFIQICIQFRKLQPNFIFI